MYVQVILHYGVITTQVRQFCSDLRAVFVGGTCRLAAFRQAQLYNKLYPINYEPNDQSIQAG